MCRPGQIRPLRGGEIIARDHIGLTEVPGLELNENVAPEHRHKKGGIPLFDRP
ncbi:MAG: hypothetical protein AB1425_06070 [Actinomycetota bacterium]